MKLFLLTHQNELLRQTNTGSLAVSLLRDDIEVIIWKRTHPSQKLLDVIAGGNVALLYPHSNSEALGATVLYDNYIIIDSTWQEAQKIYNKSPYLQTLPCVKIQTDSKSVYSLRRNQKEGGLCTAEIIIEVLKNECRVDEAKQLEILLYQKIR